MKSFNNKKLVAVVALSSLALLSGCGRSSATPVGPGVGNIPGGVVGGGYASGCVALNTTTTIPFTGANLYYGLNGDGAFRGGTIPNNPQAYGQVMVGGAVAPQVPNLAGSGLFRGQRVDGTQISVTLTPTTTITQNMPYVSVNATGTIQLSQQIQSMLMQTAMGGMNGNVFGSFPQQPGTVTQQTCVSGLAFDLKHTISSQWLYLGYVYFYLNGQPHGMALDF